MTEDTWTGPDQENNVNNSLTMTSGQSQSVLWSVIKCQGLGHTSHIIWTLSLMCDPGLSVIAEVI